MKKSKCDEDCNGENQYSDGIFSLCLCEARNMNTFVGANFKHVRQGNRPAKEIVIRFREKVDE